MIFLLLLFTGGCAFWDLKKRRIPNGMLLLGGLLFLLIRFGLGMKMGYTARMGRAAAGIWGGAYDGDWRDLWIFDSCREFTDCPVPSVSVSYDRCGGHQNGSRPVWCRRAAAGRADFPVRAGSCRNMVTCITYPAWDCQAAAYISCVLFVPVRAWGKRRAVLSGSAGWKRGIFLSGTVPVSGGDWGGADSVSVGEMVCD